MTNFELKLIEFLDEDAVELLWKEAVEEAKENEEREDDIREYARNAFIDILSDYVYEVFGKIEDRDIRELLEAAFDDTDTDYLANYIIVNKNFTI